MWNCGELKISKVAPALNQLGIENSSSVDESIKYYIESLNWESIEEYLFFNIKVVLLI